MATRGYISWARLQIPPPLLVGQAATIGQGTATPTVSVTLTGQSLTTAQGTLAGGTQRAYVSWTQLTIPVSSGITQALTGQALTTAAGSVGAGTRAYLSWARLQIPSAPNVTLTGQAITMGRGTLTGAQGTVQALTGQALTTAAGSVAQGRAASLTGLSTTVVGGTLTGSSPASLLAGVQMTMSAGTLTPDDVNFILAGVLSPSTSVNLTGFGLTTGAGLLSVISGGNVTVPLLGQAIGMSRGAFVALPVVVPLTGQALSMNMGSLTPVNTTPQAVSTTGGVPYRWQRSAAPKRPAVVKPKPAPKPVTKQVAAPVDENAWQSLYDAHYAELIDAALAKVKAEESAKEEEQKLMALLQQAHEQDAKQRRELALRILKLIAQLKLS